MNVDFIRTLPQYLMPQRAMNGLAGLLANCEIPVVKDFLIADFIKRYGVDMTLAVQEDPKIYHCFNDFFIRQLKPACRPIASSTIVSPVDGVVSQLGAIEEGCFIQAKGQEYSVDELLACPSSLSQCFHEGQFATFYLSPKDYHRIHMPIEGTLREMVYVPGELFSVQPLTARTIPRLFARNERLVVFFETKLGLMAMVLVGAVIVGSINTVWHGEIFRSKAKAHYNYQDLEETIGLLKGEEMGHFKLGSTVILLFAKGNKIQWQPQLQVGHAVTFGQAIADLKR